MLHDTPVSWGITPLYFFSWNSIHFQQKEPIKVQIWWNFTWAVKCLIFFTLMDSFCPEELSLITLKTKANFKEKMTCNFTYGMRILVNVHPTTQKPENFFLMGSFCPKHTRFELQKTKELSCMILNSDAKFQ